MAKALLDRKKDGKIFTIDILPHNKKIIWNCIEDFNGKSTRIELLIIGTNFLNILNSNKVEVRKF